MTPAEIYTHLEKKFAGRGLVYEAQETIGGDPFIRVPAECLLEVARYLRDAPGCSFEQLHCLSGVDYQDHLTSVIHLFSFKHRHKITIKTDCPVDSPHIPSVASIWPAANWHERESYDLLGIIYDGHPNLKRILLSEDWEGHPLRKNYKQPDETPFWNEPSMSTRTETPLSGSESRLERPETSN